MGNFRKIIKWGEIYNIETETRDETMIVIFIISENERIAR
jgi:hypothetical protein